MTFSVGKRCRQERIDDVVGQLGGHDAGTETDDVGIIVFPGQPGGSGFRAAAGTDAFVLVAGNGDAYARTADGDAEVDSVWLWPGPSPPADSRRIRQNRYRN